MNFLTRILDKRRLPEEAKRWNVAEDEPQENSFDKGRRKWQDRFKHKDKELSR